MWSFLAQREEFSIVIQVCTISIHFWCVSSQNKKRKEKTLFQKDKQANFEPFLFCFYILTYVAQKTIYLALRREGLGSTHVSLIFFAIFFVKLSEIQKQQQET